MNQHDFSRFAQNLLSEAHQIIEAKGKDYARGGNAFHNFETTAEFLGLKREEVLASHLYKHFAAIFAFIREGQVETEPIRGRIIDAINYLTFLAAMAEEPRENQIVSPQVSESDPFPYVRGFKQQELVDAVAGWKREEAVDLAPGRELVTEGVEVHDNQLRLFIDTGPPWYLPRGPYHATTPPNLKGHLINWNKEDA